MSRSPPFVALVLLLQVSAPALLADDPPALGQAAPGTPPAADRTSRHVREGMQLTFVQRVHATDQLHILQRVFTIDLLAAAGDGHPRSWVKAKSGV